jgi:O-antigen/teichoic acid export membrane protein
VVAGQAGVAVAGLGGLRLLTTLLSPDQFGRLILGVSLAMLVQQLTFGPLAVATLRHTGHAVDEKELGLLVGAVDRLLMQAFLAALAAAAVAATIVLLIGWTHWASFGLLCLWFATASGVLNTRLAIDAAQRNRGWVSAMQVASETAKYLAAGAAVAILTSPDASAASATSATPATSPASPASAAMAGFAVAATIFALIQRRRARGSGGVSPGRAGWRAPLLRVARPLAATGALTWSQMASDRWALNAVLSTAHVGAYGVVYQIAVAPFTLLGAMVQQLAAPVVFRIAGSGTDPRSVRASHTYVLVAAAILLLGTAAAVAIAWRFHEAIFGLLVGPGFAQYSYLLPLGVVVGGFLATGQVMSMTVLSRDAAQQLVLPKAVTAVLGLVLNVLGAVFFGVVGVLWANVVFSLVFLVWLSLIALGPDASRTAAA